MDSSVMEMTTIKVIKLTASEGMYLTNGEVFSKEIYLGKIDSPENWHEITEEEKLTLEAELLKEDTL